LAEDPVISPETRVFLLPADTLGCLSIDGMYAALRDDCSRHCGAGWSCEYLTEFLKRRAQAPLRFVGA
jgi:hypothetical protein